MQHLFIAFQNESDGLTTRNLTIKNGIEMITIEDSSHISKDKLGVEASHKCNRNLSVFLGH